MKTYINLFILLLVFMYSGSLLSQCYQDRHSTNWFDGWISCETSPNPNDANGDTHWIMYDFEDTYELGQMHVWNTNDPKRLEYGMKRVLVDYSLNGMDWQNLGEFDFQKASGKSIYEGFEGPDFDGISARYVLITGIENFGGSCYGLSEIRIAIDNSSVDTEDLALDLRCASVENGLLLEWSIIGNQDGVTFDIERSQDGEKWEVIKITESYDLGSGTHTFHYIDNGTEVESAYYRIISKIGIDSEEISQEHFCNNDKLDIRVFPNPMKEEATLEISSSRMEEIYITIVDVLGKEIYSEYFYPNSISSTIKLENAISHPGQYFIMVQQGHLKRELKLFRM